MFWAALVSAFWLGILTAISPCPLASNIAAVSFISRGSTKNSRIVISGSLYALGRVLAYAGLGSLLAAGLLNSPEISRFLQKYMNQALGPILILVGLLLLGWLQLGFSLPIIGAEKLQAQAEKRGLLWAFPIGMLFALSFCPVSAGLYFGALLPLLIKFKSWLILPLAYGIGTSLPVVVFAFLMVSGSQMLSRAFSGSQRLHSWFSSLVGTVFIGAGIYYCLAYIYEVI